MCIVFLFAIGFGLRCSLTQVSKGAITLIKSKKLILDLIMKISENLRLSVVVGLGSLSFLTITKPANAANFHTHCAVLPYTAPSGNIPVTPATMTDFSVEIPINVSAASQTDCPGGVVGNYEISDLTSISLGLGGQGTWDVTIDGNLFKNQFFASPNFVPFSLPPHQQPKAIEFNFVDNTPDFLTVSFKAVNVTSATGTVNYRDPKGNHYYRVPEPSSPLSLLALVTLGAALGLKRKLKSSQSTEKETAKVSYTLNG